MNANVMTMIWPGRALGVALLVPGLGLAPLFIDESIWPLVVALDVAVGLAAVVDLFTLIGARRLRVERQVSGVCSLNEPEQVELVVENMGRAPRSLRLRDDVPDVFAVDPVAFDVSFPATVRPFFPTDFVPKRRGTYRFEQVDALVASRLGFWRRHLVWPLRTEVRVYPDIHQIARYTMLARRDRLAPWGCGGRGGWGRITSSNACATTSWATIRATSTGGPTARRRKLTCRAFQLNQSQRIIFMIDCGRLMSGNTGDGLSPLDHAFNAMLLLAHVALIRGDQVGLLAFSDRIRAYVAPGGGPRRINRIVHSVHNVFPEMVESRYDRAFIELSSAAVNDRWLS